ncbi:MAG: aminoacyl-tRNA hydrolase [Clostridia bacterium]|nr:aminoacyl-tRNA hydrolase [Clostridia bacterium]
MSIFDLFKKIEAERPAGGAVEAIVCGLGNPGPKYEKTRHNVGFEAIDILAARVGVRIDRLKWRALTAEASLGGLRVLLMKPQTFMNDSGAALREAAAFYHIPPERVVVLCDDTSLPCGRLRVRGKGSHGGHNGLKSVIAELGGDNFPRVKIGVGASPAGGEGMTSWVLGHPVPADRALIEQAEAEAALAPEVILKDGVDAACGRFNGFRAEEGK